jgi:hypothetical protein
MGSHTMGGGQNLLKISHTFPWIKMYQMIPLTARSISLESNFQSTFWESWKNSICSECILVLYSKKITYMHILSFLWGCR